MADDQPFRIVLAVSLLLLAPVGLYHRLRSQATGEPLDRRREGLFVLVSLRLAGLLTALAVLAWLADPSWLAWAAVPLPAWVRWAGVGLVAAGGVLMTWTFRHLGRNLTDTVVTRREHTLVTTGPYRWVRHPFYGAAGFLLAGIALVTACWLPAVTGVTALALLVIRTGREEGLLAERFGDEYRQYAGRTGRFLPRWRA